MTPTQTYRRIISFKNASSVSSIQHRSNNNHTNRSHAYYFTLIGMTKIPSIENCSSLKQTKICSKFPLNRQILLRYCRI